MLENFAHAVEEIRRAEQKLLDVLPEGALMERAATGLARVCLRILQQRVGRTYGSRAVLLVGSGNNGGDALVAGGLLARRGVAVEAVLLSEQPYARGLALFRAAGGRVAASPADALEDADLVIDGIVGIGGRGGLRPEAVRLLQEIGPTAVIVAVDVPSGVDADTGVVAGEAVRADVTVTFGALKPGLLVDPGAAFAGDVELVDIGLELDAAAMQALRAGEVRAMWPRPSRKGDKYARGALGVVAGSPDYPGAAVLCVGGALRAGCGYVRVAAPDGVADVVRQAWPEAVVAPLTADDPVASTGQVQAWLAGPGMGTDERAAKRLRAVLDSGLPAVLDADALTVVAADPTQLKGRDAARTLLTPHAGELARLLDRDRSDVEANRLASVRTAAEQFQVSVLLKGATTLIAAPDGRTRVSASGIPELGTAGSGDVLSGICGALLAAGLPALDAGALGAWVHGAAARTASCGGPIIARDVVEALPAVLATLASD